MENTVETKSEPYEGMFDWSGSCSPIEGRGFSNQHTFSVGIFQWRKKASGKGFKKSAVLRRVKGYMHSPRVVYDEAQSICDDLNKDARK